MPAAPANVRGTKRLQKRCRENAVTLEQWRRAKGYTFEQLGRRYGVKPSVAFAHCQPIDAERFKMPRPAAMLRIYYASRGAVTPNDFFPIRVRRAA